MAALVSDLINRHLAARSYTPTIPAALTNVDGNPVPLALRSGGGEQQPTWSRVELGHAVYALLQGAVHIDDFEAARHIPRAERASAAFDAAVRLKHLVADRGEARVAPVNPWVAMVALADARHVLTDGGAICWISPRASSAGRVMITYTTAVESAAQRLLAGDHALEPPRR